MLDCNTHILLFFLLVILLMVTSHELASASAIDQQKTKPSFDSNPSNIHAMIVSSSRYWFNYRHAINALGIYEIYRQNGIPDENIILSTSLVGSCSSQELLIPQIHL